MDEEGKWVTIRGRHVFIKNGQTVSEAIKEYEENKNKTSTTYYRGLTQKYDPNYDKSKLDNPNGYESWTDSLELAKEYAGKNGYVYSVEIPNNELNPDDIYDQDGERSLMYYNDKPVALHGVEGEEFMLYTDHEKWNDLEYKEVIKKENYNNYSTDRKAPISEVFENNAKIGKELFDTPSNEDLDQYVSYGINLPKRFEDKEFKQQYDKNIEGIKDLKTPLKQKTIFYVGINKDEDITKRNIISASINEGTARLYKTSKNGEVARIFANEDTDIISTYNAKEKGRDDNYHFKAQGEVILMLDTNKIIRLDNNDYLIELIK